MALSDQEALDLGDAERPWADLCAAAAVVRDCAFGRRVTFSPKAFLPLTNLCRNRCDYCSFRRSPGEEGEWTMRPSEVESWLARAQSHGCSEALFCLGDTPETAFSAYRRTLEEVGHGSTVDYLYWSGSRALDRGMLPHTNAGLLKAGAMARLREVNVSLGLMLENVSPRLCEPGMPHHRAPDKRPEQRLRMIDEAGRLRIPFTTGILVGIGETRRERVESLLAIRRLHRKHGHIQEVIVQNFRAVKGVPMMDAPEPDEALVTDTVALARLILDPEISLQAPPNLNPSSTEALLAAGVNDFGGISPVTPDYINPLHPWPHLDRLAQCCARAGFELEARAPIYDRYVDSEWLDPRLHAIVRDVQTRLRRWELGVMIDPEIGGLLDRALDGEELSVAGALALCAVNGPELEALLKTADTLRRIQVGDEVSYVVNRNINFTNVCVKACRFCAFSRTQRSEEGYFLEIEEIVRRALQARDHGATEVCLQAGLVPGLDPSFYLNLVRALKRAAPDLHLHAFSPEEVKFGAELRGISIYQFLVELKEAGLDTLPGTSAEVLDDELRHRIAPGRITTAEWIDVMRSAHALGLPTTSTLMYGHVESDQQRMRHLGLLRSLQKETGGFTEFVPLSFVHEEAPMHVRRYLPDLRPGPTQTEVARLYAIARLMLGASFRNIQVSWVKEGIRMAPWLLGCGANDLGGTLINESISTSAGAAHGQFQSPADLRRLIRAAGRIPVQRDTRYRKLRTFGATIEPDEETSLDHVVDAEAIFGSYAQLTQDARFRFRLPMTRD